MIPKLASNGDGLPVALESCSCVSCGMVSEPLVAQGDSFESAIPSLSKDRKGFLMQFRGLGRVSESPVGISQAIEGGHCHQLVSHFPCEGKRLLAEFEGVARVPAVMMVSSQVNECAA